MRVVESAAEMRRWSECLRRAGRSVGLVPTLGGLHDGHIALVRQARTECEKVVVSIYLNPTQFDASQDLAAYPARQELDLELCALSGVDIVYLGRAADLLCDGFQSWVTVEELTAGLCGSFRPGHFRGVATVVAQLFHVVLPHRAYFGLKDFQQAMAVRRMARDLVLNVEIRLHPTVREPDGLALSTRNVRLSPVARAAAPSLYRALAAVRDVVRRGERDVAAVVGELRSRLESDPALRIEYAEVVEAEHLRPYAGDRIEPTAAGLLIAAAVWVGGVRLIDNVWVEPRELGGRPEGEVACSS